MTKQDLVARIQKHGTEAAFLANVIWTRQPNPSRKLRGLWLLLAAGYDVRTLQFSSDTLIVDGQCKPWFYLDEVAHQGLKHSI